MSLAIAVITWLHVVISLAGIVSGVPVIWGLLRGKHAADWTAVFLATNIATSVSGFFFPFVHFTPAHALAIASLVVLGLAVVARYTFRLAGGWRSTYVLSAVSALYLNVFVLVIQLFGKVAALRALAPTQSEWPFVVAQAAVLALFIGIAVAVLSRSRPRPSPWSEGFTD